MFTSVKDRAIQLCAAYSILIANECGFVSFDRNKMFTDAKSVKIFLHTAISQ